MKRSIIIFSLFVFLAATLLASSNGPQQETRKAIDLFTGEEILKVSIFADLDALFSDLSQDPDYHEGLFILEEGFSRTDTLRIKLKVRGNFRRKAENCNFPPLLINFRKSDVEKYFVQGSDKLKLVTHCQADNPEYLQLIGQEYLVYKLYNLITPFSYRVRLLQVSYHDTAATESEIHSLAFLLEWDDDMAARNHAKLVNEQDVPMEKLHRESYNRMAMFQYMINNNDWLVPILHNIDLLSVSDSAGYIPVPYDFDWAGMVEAPYRKNPQKTEEDGTIVPLRPYYGLCKTYEEFSLLADYYNSKKHDMITLYRSARFLRAGSRHNSLMAIREFYQMINNRSKVKKVFLGMCPKEEVSEK